MHPTFKKLNFAGQPAIYILSAPESFEGVLGDMQSLTDIRRAISPADHPQFALAFCTRLGEVSDFAAQCAQSGGAQSEGDATIWLAYPKQSSKRYHCEFNRDTAWQPFAPYGFEPVRQVALDEDWSALRLRRGAFVGRKSKGQNV